VDLPAFGILPGLHPPGVSAPAVAGRSSPGCPFFLLTGGLNAKASQSAELPARLFLLGHEGFSAGLLQIREQPSPSSSKTSVPTGLSGMGISAGLPRAVGTLACRPRSALIPGCSGSAAGVVVRVRFHINAAAVPAVTARRSSRGTYFSLRNATTRSRRLRPSHKFWLHLRNKTFISANSALGSSKRKNGPDKSRGRPELCRS